MSTTVTYKGHTLTTLTNQIKTLKTSGKYMEDDVTIQDESAGGSAVVVTEEIDEGGGIIKHITAVDLSQDTVNSAVLLSGYTAHNYQGVAITGSYDGAINNQDKTVNPSTTQQTIQADNGYTGLGVVTVNAMPTGTAGTPTASKGAVSNHSLTVTPSVTNTTGYITGGTKTGTGVSVSASELVSGSQTITTNNTYDVTNLASVVVSVSGGGSNLQAKTNINPTTSSQTITPDTGYDGLSSVQINAMPSGTAGTPTATKGTVNNHSISVTPSVTNTTGYITGSTKTGTAVTVSASELVSGSQTITTNNTYDVTNLASVIVNVEGGGGGGSVSIGTADKALSTAGSSIQFTGLSGEPIAFSFQSTEALATGASPFKVAAVVYDGSSHHGQTITNTNNAQVTYDGTSFSHTYSNGTLTVTSTGAYFQPVTYHLIYAYGGTSSNVETVNVQVGSGATSITFTGVDEDPEYWSCIFKSNFNTSSGYQRVIFNQFKDGSGVTGLEMDSSAKYSNQHWSYTYSGGSLTISSQGTNAGGYYHQPGYYQLTYIKGSGGGGGGNYQSKTVNPSTSQQTVTPDTGYDALSQVTVTAMPSGSAGTPTASKGAVSNHSITVTPSVTNTTGYITGGTKTGTAVTVSASELVSGTKSITANGTGIDVTNYASVDVAVSGGAPVIDSLSVTPTESEQTFNSLSVDGYKPVTVAAISNTYVGTSVPRISSVTVNANVVTAPSGYYSSQITGTVATASAFPPALSLNKTTGVITGTNAFDAGYYVASTSTSTISLSTKAGTTITPTEAQQTAVASGYFTLGSVFVAAISSTYVGTGITTRSSADLTANGSTVTAPAGYYATQATKNISAGSAFPPAVTITTNPTISLNSTTGVITATYAGSSLITPTVTAGYISQGTAGTISTAGTSTFQLTSKAASTYYTSTADQTIASRQYLIGTQTIKSVTYTGLAASQIASGVTVNIGDSGNASRIVQVVGTLAFQTYYSGSTTPASSLGVNGDIYLQT